MKQREILMNAKEAAKKWNVSDRTVRGWCKDGWIITAKFDEKERLWLMYTNALQPYKFSKNKYKHHNDRLALVLKALDERKTFPPAKMNYDNNEILELFQELQKLKFIQHRKTSEDDIFQNYKLTKNGGDYLLQRKGLRKIASDLSPLIEAVAKGATGAIIENKQ